MSFTPTAEMQAIDAYLVANPSAHLIVDAKAGAGKTTKIVAALPLLRGTSILMSFNRSIADELKRRVGDLGIMVAANVSVSTVHSHGLASFRMAGLKPQTQGGKLHFIMKDQVANYPDDDPVRKNNRHIVRAVSLAKNKGLGLTACDGRETFASITDKDAWADLLANSGIDTEFEADLSVEAAIDECIELLQSSNARRNMIDFDDMVYMPLLFNMPIRQYANVIIDEAQDINPTRRELAFRSVAKGGRIIAVGDPNQAIYGFTGADHASLDNIRKRCEPDVAALPLSICWRCSDAVLDEARKLVPGIQTAPRKIGTGTVSSVAFRREPGTLGKDDIGSDFLALPQPGDAILCRLNKPNVAVALGLIRRGTPAKIEGRDLGKRLVDHIRKGADMHSFQPLADTIVDLERYKEVETYKLVKKDREAAAALLEDEIDASIMLLERVIEQSGNSAKFTDVEALADSLFGDDIPASRVVTLSSIHKAKGREWRRVYLLGKRDYMPFWKAESPAELQQEYNLIYVGQTRAEVELIYVDGVASALANNKHREAALVVSVRKVTPGELQAEVIAMDQENWNLGADDAFLKGILR